MVLMSRAETSKEEGKRYKHLKRKGKAPLLDQEGLGVVEPCCQAWGKKNGLSCFNAKRGEANEKILPKLSHHPYPS
jgi:hypothetical protein